MNNLNDTTISANFSVGLFANTMRSPGAADNFLFQYYPPEGVTTDPPQQWTITCSPGVRLTLVGKAPGILKLQAIFQPRAWKIPTDTPVEWDTFTTDANGTLDVNDGSALTTRRWVAYKGSNETVYDIGLYDGKLRKKGQAKLGADNAPRRHSTKAYSIQYLNTNAMG
jgi:hypothetical protein